jgi:ATP-dependent Clp protease ATP-binding subunit ClpC
MFERFTDRARSVLVLAQSEARRLDHHAIGTEHILLGLIHEDGGVAAKVLKSLSVSLGAVREKVDEVREKAEETLGAAGTPPTGSPPFTQRAKKVLELSLREALQLGHSYIGTEHMLLGLVREGEGVGAQVLQSLGADLDTVRHKVIQLLSGYEGATSVGPRPQTPPASRPVRSGVPTNVVPSCPQCHAGLADVARFRAITVAPGLSDDDRDPIPIDVVYCNRCGTTLEMFRSEPH